MPSDDRGPVVAAVLSKRDGPQDSKTDMRWVIEQRPDIVEGYLSGMGGPPAEHQKLNRLGRP